MFNSSQRHSHMQTVLDKFTLSDLFDLFMLCDLSEIKIDFLVISCHAFDDL